MKSIRGIFRYGMGPSSSHTMGPRRAAEIFRARMPDAEVVRVHLFGSLSLTGKGHLTDLAIAAGLSPLPFEVVWHREALPAHPNGMRFEGFEAGKVADSWEVYSIGGGALAEAAADGTLQTFEEDVYPVRTMSEVLDWCAASGRPISDLVLETEGAEAIEHLRFCQEKMEEAITRGLAAGGTLPGPLQLERRAGRVFAEVSGREAASSRTGLLAAFALAVSEENAAGGFVVTAPTCGSAGVLPAVLRYVKLARGTAEEDLLGAVATAGIVGSVVKSNASISGAEVGCQGEVGAACAMAAAAAAQLLGGSPKQCEYAAEMALEHHLGLTCDPVLGMVQIPCIERNALAAVEAMACAEFALLTDGSHRVGFDQTVEAMRQTGHDLMAEYRETSLGGLAKVLAPSAGAGTETSKDGPRAGAG